MRVFWDKRKLTLAAALLIIAVLAISPLGGQYDFPLSRSILINILKPVNIVFSAAGNAAVNSWRMLGSLMYLYEENGALKKEVADLRRANIDAGEIWAENERLRALLDFKRRQDNYTLLPARVIGFNPGGLEGAILIDRGLKDGVKREMAVVTDSGLVGNIVEVYRGSSRVQLILHPRSAVGGIVLRSVSRVSGVVSGNISTPNTPSLLNLARDADILPGDTILTSGFGSIYPHGIVIGVVSHVLNAEGGLLKYAILEPTVDFERLEEVLVITNAANYQHDTMPAAAVAER